MIQANEPNAQLFATRYIFTPPEKRLAELRRGGSLEEAEKFRGNNLRIIQRNEVFRVETGLCKVLQCPPTWELGVPCSQFNLLEGLPAGIAVSFAVPAW